ncbi:MAG: hypothetical protein SYNGOMJ08_00856 [Candidatus Syntrophoarchaeum sp. GoM_oil]|nr:MAG: hypothetical protein SYNGOMJ08_00856 [Candidatus Syntrophoarchaeum sp. GoM_oil]
MDTISMITLILAGILLLEIVIVLLKLEVDKMLLLFPVLGTVFLAISYVLTEYNFDYFKSLSENAMLAMTYGTLIIGVLLGLICVLVWFKGNRGARAILSQAQTVEDVVGSVENDLREGERELTYFSDEMSEMREKVRTYESRGGK